MEVVSKDNDAIRGLSKAILEADTEKIQRQLNIIMGLEYLLTEEQYQFIAAKTKKEAQDFFASRQVDLVLLDVSLPDGNGFDLCREIKEKNAMENQK